ncbi:MAG TPA: metallophosphoesterase [Steroidobacteraceae bacterium]|nr:metallophosphoesterase [Steroidobacteraceae bacterium]
MIIAQISDTHIALEADDAGGRTADLERTLADIDALDPPADVIIHTGDVTHGGRREDYAAVASLLGRARAPVYVAIGNRDDRGNLRRALSRWLPAAPGSSFLDYAVEDFPVRLIALDTVSPGTNKGDFSAERARHLTALIEAEPGKPIAVFMHHPPFTVRVGPDPLNFVTPQAMATLRQALEGSGRVVAVFCGHVHRSTWGGIGSIPVMVAPCTATALRKGDFPPTMASRPVYHLHRLNSAGELVTEVRIVGDAQHRQAHVRTN